MDTAPPEAQSGRFTGTEQKQAKEKRENMPTKKQLLEALETLADDDPIPGLFDQNELEAKLGQRLSKVKAAGKEQLDAAAKKNAELAAQLAEVNARIQEIEDNAASEGKTEIEKLQADLAKVQKAQETWQERHKAAEQTIADLKDKRANDFKQGTIRRLLKDAGADPDQLEDLAVLAEHRHGAWFQVEEQNWSHKYQVVNPDTLETVDGAELFAQFVASRPGFQKSKPAGGGSPPAGPGKTPPPKNPLEGLPPGPAQFRAAYAAGARIQRATDTEPKG